jgi:glycosyltransferase involved in cell wall biosynthesis
LGEDRQYKVTLISPTCFFYQTAIYQELASNPRLDLTVCFCSKEGLHGGDVARKFNTKGRWTNEEDLLHGYNHKFLRNFSPKPSYLSWPFGLINIGIWNELRRQRPDVVILMSWMNPTWWFAILACLYFKIPFMYMTDTNVQGELNKSPWKATVKNLLIGKGLFKLAFGFLYVGEANRRMYKYYGVPDKKLVDFAFTWGYRKFLNHAKELTPQKTQHRINMGIPVDSRVILYCGRFSKEKSPSVLLKAFHRLDLPRKELVFLGDGKLRKQLEQYVSENNIDSVHFVGFKNREEISKYYSIADVLVLPSAREATGAVINEAMCFRLPIIVSDQVGFSMDLVQDQYNGYCFPVGDIDALTDNIKQLFQLPVEERLKMGDRSYDLMTEWSQRDLAESLVGYLDYSHHSAPSTNAN